MIFCFGVSSAYLTIFWLLPAVTMTVIAGYAATINIMLWLLLSLVAAAVYLPIIYQRYFIHYAITDRRVMTREGLLHKTFVTADLPSVTDITINESFLERIFTRTGVIGINTAGSNHVELHFDHVKRPFVLRKEIYRNQYKVIEERKLASLQKGGFN